MTRIKMVHRGSAKEGDSPYRMQTPNNSGRWKDAHFIFDPFETNYDWLVVIDDMPRVLGGKEKLQCPRENTILVTTEPSHISRYGRAFASQFAYLITNQDENILPHPKAWRRQTGNYWFYGKSFDEIVSMSPPPKNKLISTVCSSKREGHTLHRMRYDFTAYMETKIEQLERFGHGIRWVKNKFDALDAYAFHVTIENQAGKDIWTEKLADAFLGYCVPIYYGCSNVYDYFPKESLVLIDINDFDASIETIRELITTPGEYEKRLDAVIEARRRVIEEYNLVAMIYNLIQSAPKSTITTKPVTLYNRRMMRARHLPDFFRFAGWKVKTTMKNVPFLKCMERLR